MQLPNLTGAVVAPEKVHDYLLTEEPEKGRGKPGFFVRFGFVREQWEVLADALREHAERHDATEQPDPWGTKYLITGEIESPDGRNLRILEVWLVDTGKDVPRFISARPVSERRPQ